MNVSREERAARMLVSACPGVGSRRVAEMIRACGSVQRALCSSATELQVAAGLPLPVAREVAERAARRDPMALLLETERLGLTVLTWEDEGYPAKLLETYDPPAALYLRGSLTPEDHFAIAVVGARNCTERGRWTAQQLAAGLAEAGVTVVSGLARGIDSAAHWGALRAGRTLAVLGCGLDVIYPGENRGLAEEIVSKGALLSEYPPGTPPLSRNFPARNRIISGLAHGTVVVEASIRSGAMITAGFAAEQNREVFAVPGPANFSGSQGPHRLIRDGANLVETVDDILSQFGQFSFTWSRQGETASATTSEAPASATRLAALLADGPCSLESLAERSGRSVAQVAAEVTMLEMDGRVKTVAGGLLVLAT